MTEHLPEVAQEAVDVSGELGTLPSTPPVREPAATAGPSRQAKLTVPLREDDLPEASVAPRARITRPLVDEASGEQTATHELSSSLSQAKTTRPLSEQEEAPLPAEPGVTPTPVQTEEADTPVAQSIPEPDATLTPAQTEETDTLVEQSASEPGASEIEAPSFPTPETVIQSEQSEAVLEKLPTLLSTPEESISSQAKAPTAVVAGDHEDTQPRLLKVTPTAQSPHTPSEKSSQPREPAPAPPSSAHMQIPTQAGQRSTAPTQRLRSTGMSRRKLKRIYRLQHFSRKHLRHARATERRERRRLWTTIWTTTISLLLLFLVSVGTASYIAYNFVVVTQGTYAGQILTLRDLLPPDNLKIYDMQGKLIDQLTDQGIHTEVPYNQIAPNLVNATVAIEDRTFWQNSGVDLTGILRAAFADLESGEALQGGSTITQQLIKQLIVGNATDAQRKLSELVLAPQVNSHYSKQDIMEMYLNTIYYGHQAYGIDAAATVFFGLEDKPGQSAASQLDLAQAAFLAGLPRNAALYDPAVNPIAANSRFYDVLQAMVAQNDITQVQAQSAYQEGLAPGFFKSSPTLQDQAPHFDEYVLTQLEQMYHLTRAQLSRSGLDVYTTVNVTLQNQILTIMQQHIAEIRDAHHVTNAAEVLIDFHTGAIISMLGSIDYNDAAIDGQFNVALAYRQPGSSFKPYVYVTAFAQGASPAQAVDDGPTTFNVPDSNPPTYTPSNYDQQFHGQMTLRCALQNSLNVPAVRVLQHVGVKNAMATAQAMGITSYEGTPGLSLVLGGLDVRLLDHTSAIGVFADNGVRQPYYSISKVVQGTTGKVLFQHQFSPGTQVISPQLAYMMTSVLSDNTSRIPEFFDCNVLQLYANSQQDCYEGNRGLVRPAAAKTGTTQDFRDNWTVGYTTDYVMGVWAGNDDNSPMINVTGVQGAAPIWHDAMLLAEQGHPIQDFQNPGGLQRATVTYADGVTSTDWFLPGTVPHNATPTPGPDQDSPAPATATPYCSTFSYAFQPPANGGIPANGEWWEG